MSSRKTTKAAAAAVAGMPSIPKELIDQFVTRPMSAEAVQDISMAFKKALIERALGADLSHHLGYPPGAVKPEDASNHRNGASGKTVREIQGFLAEQYGTEVSPEFISSVTVVAAWRRAWDRVIPFFAFPPAVRRVIYTTNAIHSIHSQLRKIINTRAHFPSEDAASKLIWLALRNITADWGRAAKEWREAMKQFAIAYADRFTQRAV